MQIKSKIAQFRLKLSHISKRDESVVEIHFERPEDIDEAFMVKILNESLMKGVSGIVRYRDEFDEAI